VTSSRPVEHATELGATGWQKPWSGTGGEDCVEVKPLPESGEVAMRQSKDPEGVALLFGQEAMTSFVAAAKAGQADFLL
jgi:hypothetical protein